MKRRLVPLLLSATLGLAPAAEQADPLQASLPWRTALHHDPSLEEPLDRLVAVYRQAGREADLIELYRRHCLSYGKDAGAWAVGARILMAIGSPDIDDWFERALAANPDDAYLHVLLAEHRQRRGLAGRSEALRRAVETARDPARKRSYARLLILHLVEGGAADGLDDAIAAFRRAGPQDVEAELRLLRELIDRGRVAVAADWLADLRSASAELQVERDLLLARARREQGRGQEAVDLLEALLERLDHAYWRRDEVLQRRLALVGQAEGRQRLLADLQAAVERRPGSDQVWLDLVAAQQHFGRGRQAVETLEQAAVALPRSPAIEEALIEAMQRRGDYAGLEAWLAERLADQPERLDLLERRVELLFTLERHEEAQAALQRLLAALDADTAADRQLHLARRLVRIGLEDTARELLRGVWQRRPQRLDLLRELLELLAGPERRRLLQPQHLEVAAAGEQTRDLARWLRTNGHLRPAVTVLEHQLELADSGSTRDLLLRCLVDIGDLRAAQTQLEELRGRIENLADYQRWLESAELVYAGDPDLLWRELARQEEAMQADQAGAAERALSVAERLAQDPDHGERLLTWFERVLPAWPADSRTRLRHIQVDLLAQDHDRRGQLLGALASLAEEDRTRADDLAVRRLALTLGRREAKIAEDDLAGILWERVRDTRALARLAAVVGRDQPALALPAYRRLAELEPDEPRYWQAWLNILQQTGDATGFARTLRRVLAAPDLDLTPAVRARLARSMRDILWISISQGLAWGDMESGEIRSLLTEVEALRRPEDQAWLAWARLEVARLDEDPQAAAEARAALLAVLDEKDGLRLPDGSWCAAAELRRLLDSPPPPATSPPAPLPPYRLRWARRADELPTVFDGQLLVRDRGALVAIDRHSGKQRWHRDLGGRLRPVVEGGLLIVPDGDEALMAIDGQGNTVWRARLNRAPIGLAPFGGDLALGLADGTVLVLEAASGRRLRHLPPPARPEAADGGDIEDLLLHYRGRHRGQAPEMTTRLFAVDGDRILIGGRHPRLIDGSDGRLLWDWSQLARSHSDISLREPPPGLAGLGWGGPRLEPVHMYLGGGWRSGQSGDPLLVNDVVYAVLRCNNATRAAAVLEHDSIVFQADGQVFAVRLGLPPALYHGFRVLGDWLGSWRGRHLVLEHRGGEDAGFRIRLMGDAQGSSDQNGVFVERALAGRLHNNLLISCDRQGLQLQALTGGPGQRWAYDETTARLMAPLLERHGSAEEPVWPDVELRVDGDLLLLRAGDRLLALEHAGG